MMHGARALSRARTHAVLERIALHQTRLQTPGLTLDAKGVALGAKGLLLLPSIDRLVGLLSIYSRDRSLEDIVSSLSIHTVRSKLGAREITFEFAAESSDRMDRLGEACRLVGGLAFTGTARHFVKYRDAMAPFGYDATELLSTDAAFALYSDRFTQTYEVERPLALRSLLVRLMLRPDASTRLAPGPRARARARCVPASVGRCRRGVRRRVAARQRVRRRPNPPLGRSRRGVSEPHGPTFAPDTRHSHVHPLGRGRRRRGRLPSPRRASLMPPLRSGRVGSSSWARRRTLAYRPFADFRRAHVVRPCRAAKG
jgi:hypothetical protein